MTTNWSIDNQVNFESSCRSFGDGEEKFKWELDRLCGPSKLMGSNNRFDLTDANNKKWEIKNIENDNKIRSSADGVAAAGPFIEEFLSILVQGRSFVRDAQSSVDAVFDSVKNPNIINFFEHATERVMSREVSSGMLTGKTKYYKVSAYEAISVCSDIVSTIRASYGDIEITFNGKKKLIDPARAANIFHILDEEYNSDFTCLRHLKNKFYYDKKSFENWITRKNLVDPSLCFDVDYIVLVNRIGYEIIERKDFSNRFVLNLISQNRPCFKVI